MRNYLLPFGIILTLLLNTINGFSQQDEIPDNVKDQLVTEYKITTDQLSQLILKDHYTTKHNQIEHYYFIQTIDGIEVYNAQLAVHVKDGEVVQLNNGLVWVDESTSYTFEISALDAVQFGAAYLELKVSEDGITQVEVLGQPAGEFPTFNAPEIAAEPIVTFKYLLPVNNKLVPVWNVGIYLKDHSHYWNLRIDARTGEILDKNDYVVECNWGETDHQHAGHIDVAEAHITERHMVMATQGTDEYQVFPMPVESPNHGQRAIVSNPADTFASPYGWHDINGAVGAEFNYTRGNNVLAWEDLDANNTNGQTVSGGSDRSFITDFDKSKSAANYTDAAIVNLFYWNNIMHDVWYHYGFDEPSGNFQQNNYGNGGAQGDYVIAEAQDGSGYNNANFSAFPDGTNGRMQMYLWGNVTPGTKLLVNSPQSIEGFYTARGSSFGSELDMNVIQEDVVLAEDTTANPSQGCSVITNSSAMNGKIAILDRGGCTFTQKVKNAQNAGAIAAIVINNQAGAPFSMTGTDASITIPSVMISRADGDIFKNELSKGSTVNVSLYDSTGERFFRDSDFDNGVIAHEYGHGISIRLTGGPSNSGCLSNQEQMGEGWSDFFALVMTVEPGDSGEMKRGIGTYVSGQGVNGKGIRPYAYSTNMAINPTTYADVAKTSFTVPHGVGSVWCQMIWDMYWDFVDEYGYDEDIYTGTGGNNIAMQLVIDGMKLQKCGPGFTDARDAILLADQLNNGGRNQKLIWTSFAKRGLGYSADQGSPSSRSDGEEAFDIPTHLFTVTVEKHAQPVFKGGDEQIYRFVVRNFGDSTARNIKIVDTLDYRLITRTRAGNCDWDINGNVATYTIDSLSAFDSFSCNLHVAISNEDYSLIRYEDNIENGDGIWAPELETGTGGFERTSTMSHSGDTSWFIDNPGSKSDRSLVGSLTLGGGNPALGFHHYYDTEDGWDGAVVEIDTGSGWIDLGNNFIVNGYNSSIAVNPASAISGQPAFTGTADDFTFSVIDLTDYAGKDAAFRFRFVSDAAAGGFGWFIDDVTLFDTFEVITNTVTLTPDNYPLAIASVISVVLEGQEPVGIQELENEGGKLIVYPNPTRDILYIQNDLGEESTLELIDVNGKTLKKIQLQTGENIEMDLSEMGKGVYFIRSVTAKGTTTERIILQ